MKTKTRTKEHQLQSTIESIAVVEQLIDQYKKEGEIPEILYGNCLIASTEAVSNAIKHGNHSDKNKNVFLQFKFAEKELVVAVQDEGNGYDYKNIPDPTAAGNIEKIHGRGVFIMRNLCDKVEFEDKGRKAIMYFTK